MSDTFQPVTPVSLENRVAVIPAMTTPAMVPAVAQTVFFVAPPMKYMVARVVTAHINTDTQKGEYPRYTRGRYTKRMAAKVKMSPSAPRTPCIPPTRHRAAI